VIRSYLCRPLNRALRIALDRFFSTCAPFINAYAIGSPGEWEMVTLHANGQLGAAAYRRGDDGSYYPFAVVVLATTTSHIKRISLFADPALFALFDMAPVLLSRGRPDAEAARTSRISGKPLEDGAGATADR
jgi:hypothetical protein